MNDPSENHDGHVRLTLDSERLDALVYLIENPPAPGPKLKALLHRVPAWEKRTRSWRLSGGLADS